MMNAKRKYIIIEMPTPMELAEEVSKHMEPVADEPPFTGTRHVDVYAYIPKGPFLCHPSVPHDPQRAFHFSQAMVYQKVDELPYDDTKKTLDESTELPAGDKTSEEKTKDTNLTP
jgi:hypothetical protein